MLSDASRSGNGFIKVSMPTKTSIPLSKPENKKKITDCLAQITGHTCDFQAGERKQGRAAAPDSDEADYLSKLYETFGQEPVDIVENI